MSRRRLSQHQKTRIQQAQDAISTSDDFMEGLVISHHGGNILVEVPDLPLLECSIKSNLDNIVCGDRVICELTESGTYRVSAIRPRNNLLRRIDGFGQAKSVAANITQLLICLAVKPEPNLFLLDQYLVSAQQQGINPVIILNKIDLLPKPETDPYQLESIYQPLGYKVLSISVKENRGLDQLNAVIDNNSSVLSGVSGVGKSSITQALLPNEQLKIAAISRTSDEGRHTTRTSRLYHLGNNGILIDTPGVRGFNPLVDQDIGLVSGFREIEDYSVNCRFNNCQHIMEPNCAVRAAVDANRIAQSRYQHYLKMLGD